LISENSPELNTKKNQILVLAELFSLLLHRQLRHIFLSVIEKIT
jgi:hypothetical protein